eukprot:scaffold29250_cov64-Phaeocystis_antarctica.AAC.1
MLEEFSDTQDRPTAEAGYAVWSADYAEVESSRREQPREDAELRFGAHRGALIVGDRLSCHAVREVGVGEHVRQIKNVCGPQAGMSGREVVNPIICGVGFWIKVPQARSPRDAL